MNFKESNKLLKNMQRFLKKDDEDIDSVVISRRQAFILFEMSFPQSTENEFNEWWENLPSKEEE